MPLVAISRAGAVRGGQLAIVWGLVLAARGTPGSAMQRVKLGVDIVPLDRIMPSRRLKQEGCPPHPLQQRVQPAQPLKQHKIPTLHPWECVLCGLPSHCTNLSRPMDPCAPTRIPHAREDPPAP